MERTTTTMPYSAVPEAYEAAPRFRWGAVFAGAFVAIGLWVLLYSLGLAIGLSTIDANNPRAVGIGTGVYSLVVPLIALFLGGLVAARVSGPMNRFTGALHGAVLWGLTTVAGVLTVGMLVGTLAGGVARAGGGLVSGLGAAAQQGQGTLFGLSADDLLAPINQRLQAEGKPAVTAAQIQATFQQYGRTVVQGGSFDRNQFANALAANTNLSRADARQIAEDVEQRIGGLGSQVQEGALAAANVSGAAFWGIFFSLLLGLVASVLGATAGVAKEQRRALAPVAKEAPARG